MKVPEFVGVGHRFLNEPEKQLLIDVFCPLFYVQHFDVADEEEEELFNSGRYFSYDFNELKLVTTKTGLRIAPTHCWVCFDAHIDKRASLQYSATYRFYSHAQELLSGYDYDTDLHDLAIRVFQRFNDVFSIIFNSKTKYPRLEWQ
jgi:hypothetical protein